MELTFDLVENVGRALGVLGFVAFFLGMLLEHFYTVIVGFVMVVTAAVPPIIRGDSYECRVFIEKATIGLTEQRAVVLEGQECKERDWYDKEWSAWINKEQYKVRKD